MNKSKGEIELQSKLDSFTNMQLSNACKVNLRNICKLGQSAFRMSIPVTWSDTDIIFSEAFKRLETLTTKLEEQERWKNGFVDKIKKLEKQLEDERKRNRWIPVSERLPNESKDKINPVEYDVIVNGSRWPDIAFRESKFWEAIYDHQDDFSHEREIQNVTHWMP